MSKFHNRKVDTPYGRFDSKKEYKRYLQLLELQEAGKIDQLQRQVPFELIPHQKQDGKVIERAVNYFADFVYLVDGVKIVEDTKGVKTPEYVIKRKLMLHKFGIKIREV